MPSCTCVTAAHTGVAPLLWPRLTRAGRACPASLTCALAMPLMSSAPCHTFPPSSHIFNARHLRLCRYRRKCRSNRRRVSRSCSLSLHSLGKPINVSTRTPLHPFHFALDPIPYLAAVRPKRTVPQASSRAPIAPPSRHPTAPVSCLPLQPRHVVFLSSISISPQSILHLPQHIAGIRCLHRRWPLHLPHPISFEFFTN